MRRYAVGTHVPGGLYLDPASADLAAIPPEGGMLRGAGRSYIRLPIPLPLVFLMAPLIGLLYVIILPFVGLGLLVGSLLRKAWAAAGLGETLRPSRAEAQGRAPREATRAERLPGMAAPLASLHPRQFALPAGIFFYPGHTWLGLLPNGQVKVGLDDFLRRLLGRVEGAVLPAVGATVAQGNPVARVRQGGRALTLLSPADGTVAATNPLWETDPGLAGGDPYGEGWMVRLVPTNLHRNLRDLKIAEPAVWWLQEEVRRFRDFAARFIVSDRELGPRLADGGLPLEGVLERLDDATWGRFEREFIGVSCSPPRPPRRGEGRGSRGEAQP
jgi:glycine cleavage system H lipoate-binding protein